MKTLWYLKKRQFINRLKRRLKKPLTYVWAVLIAAYAVFMVYAFSVSFEVWGLGSPEGFALILSAFTLLTMPTNLKAYAKHKGLVFLPADIHLVFPAPFSPKSILLYGMIRLLTSSWILILILTIGGIWWFHLSAAQVILYLLGGIAVDSLFEGSLVILAYGNDALPEWVRKAVSGAIYVIFGLAVALAVFLFFTVDHSLGAFGRMLAHPLLQCVPVLGWNIAMIRLILVGPTALNVICTGCYLAVTAAMAAAAVRMPCEGNYYEDALTFADEYQKALKKSKEGRMAVVGQKETYRKARVKYRGTGAEAIYYRQLLEYRKHRFFFFGFNSLLNLGMGAALAVIGVLGILTREEALLCLPLLMAYVVLIFSGYATKWEQELKNVYTFLIPDNAFRKLWYATKIEHIRNLADGCLLVLPCFAFLGLSVWLALELIALYVCLRAANLYARMVCEGILGRLFGQFGMSLAKMVLFFLVVGIGGLFGGVAWAAAGPEAGFLVMIFYGLVLTGGLAAASALLFARMEMLES